MVGRIIDTQDCLAEGADWLAARDARMAHALAQIGPLPLRRRADGFAGLLNAIVGQQVSVASARAIWSRLEAAGFTIAENVATAQEDDLRAVGMSRQKARYAKALAAAGIDFDALRAMPDAQVIATLVTVPGIGVWTAEIYAMFALGRADAFAAGDLALQIAAQALYDLPARPSEKALRALAAPWSPWRAVAARALFSYYHILKDREGVT